MWHQVDLTPADFKEWFEKSRLGELFFPVGQAYIHPGTIWFQYNCITNFYIHLQDLYMLCTEWRINHQSVPIDQIIAIIAFGSAVGPKHIAIEKIGKKYFLFGKTVIRKKKKYVQPRDADFLVITRENILKEKTLKPITLETYDCGTWIEKGGIHLVNRGIEQIKEGIRSEDTISINALLYGIPIFFTEEYKDLRAEEHKELKEVFQLGEDTKPLWTLRWSQNKEGYLVGKIE